MELQLEKPSQNGDAESVRTDLTSAADLGPAPLPPSWTSYSSLISHVPEQRDQNVQSNGSDVQPVTDRPEAVQHTQTILQANQATLQRCSEVTASLDDAETAFANALLTLIKVDQVGSANGLPAYGSQNSSHGNGAAVKTALMAALSTEADRLSKDPFADGTPQMREVASENADQQDAARICRAVDVITKSWQSVRQYDAELARLLASLLGCTDRLQTLYADTPSLAAMTVGLTSPLDTQHDSPHGDIYSKLELQAKSVQSTRLARQESYESGTSAHAVRAIEEAELELLWSRMSDLLTSVRRLHANAPSTDSHDITPRVDAGEDSFERQAGLPDYSSLAPPQYDHDVADAKIDSSRQAPATLQASVRRTSFSAVADEKLQVDLDRMTTAIERLYVASPQLANQRVEAARSGSAIVVSDEGRQRMREAQLAKLGAAIDRLSRGRMEDQRASLSGADDEQEIDALRLRSTWKGKHKERMERSLDTLLDNIDRAASRTMNDQRVAMSPRQQKAIRQAQSTAYITAESSRSSRVQSDEAVFREHLLDSARKGRMTSQDASFNHSPARSGQRSAPASQTAFGGQTNQASLSSNGLDHANDNGEEDAMETLHTAINRNRSSSIGTFAQNNGRDARSAPPSDTESSSSSAIKKRFSVTRLISGGIETLGVPMTRTRSRTSPPSAQTALSHDSEPHLCWVAEGMSSLSTVLLRACLAPGHASSQSSTSSHKTGTALTLELQSELTALLSGGSLSASIRLPEGIFYHSAQKTLDLQPKSDHFELRLAMAHTNQGHSHRDALRNDAPYSAAAFRTHRPKVLACVACGADLVATSSIRHYNDLPAENWTDMLDAWMCHSDQKLSQDLIDKGNNMWPTANQMHVRSSSMLISVEHLRSIEKANSIEAEHRSDGYWHFLQCSRCSSPVGRVTAQANADGAHFAAIWKFSVVPDVASGMPSEPLAAHVTSYLLETSLASAAHHFIIQDTETGQNRLVLWLFNPLVRLSADALSLPIEVCKIFYSIAEDGRAISDLAAEALIGNASYETHSMPSHLCTSLAMLLQQSTVIYPSSQQRFADWTVGWLQRSSSKP